MKNPNRSVLLAAIAMLASGCRHKPVEPGYGSAYINCDQPRAEILIDDRTTHRFTPAEISGIPSGQHLIRLRHLNYTSFRQTITIRPDVINRFWFVLHYLHFRVVDSVRIPGACDAAFDPQANLAFVASSHAAVNIVRIIDSSLVPQEQIAMPFTPEALAVDARSGYLCCLGRRPDSTRQLATFDRATLSQSGQNTSAEVQGLSEIRIGPGGSQLIGADPTGRRLVFFDPATARTVRSLNIPLTPDHISVSPDDRFYVASLGQSRVARIDPVTGAAAGSATTPSAPDGMFWNDDGRTAGVWNKRAKTITLINTVNWSTASGLGDIGGDTLFAVCWSTDPDYLLALLYKGNISALSTVYCPEWTSYGQIVDSNKCYTKIFLTNDPTKLLILFTWVTGDGGLQLIDLR